MKKMIAGVVVLAILVACFFLLKKHNEDAALESEAAESADSSVNIEGIPDLSGIVSVSVSNDNGDFTIKKVSDSWQLESLGSDTDADKVDEKLDSLSGAEAEQAIPGVTDFSQFGLDDPQITITLTDGSGAETSLYVGDENSITSQYYIRIGESDTVYAAGSSIYSAFSFSEDDLKAPEEESTEAVEESTEAVKESTKAVKETGGAAESKP